MYLSIPVDRIDNYVSNLSKIGVNNERDLRGFASIWNLQKIGMYGCDIQNIMQSLFQNPSPSYSAEDQILVDERRLGTDPYAFEVRSVFTPTPSRIIKNAIITFQEIGRGASGRVSKALFAPTLTLVAIKSIEIKDAITRKVVSQELKFLYEVARSQLLSSPLSESDKTDPENPKLSLLFGQLNGDVIASCRSLPKPSSTSDEDARAKLSEVQTANCPYIISFYDAYIDPEYGAVCLVLEYMNAGSIQNMLTDGKKFNEDDAAVLAFSVLNALIELHSRNILHRDIKPSNILTDGDGRVKLTDFGITKGIELWSQPPYLMIYLFIYLWMFSPLLFIRNAGGEQMCRQLHRNSCLHVS